MTIDASKFKSKNIMKKLNSEKEQPLEESDSDLDFDLDPEILKPSDMGEKKRKADENELQIQKSEASKRYKERHNNLESNYLKNQQKNK